MPRSDAPVGARVTEEKLEDEAKKKLAASAGKKTTIEDFLAAKKKAEIEQRKVMSSDLEIIKDVTPKKLLELQGLNSLGQTTGDPPRLYGWDPGTKTACVIKMASLEALKKKKKG